MSTASSTELEPGPATSGELWRRLDRRSIWVAPLTPLAGLFATALVVLTFRGWENLGLVEPVIGGVVAIGAFGWSAWYWATTWYRVTATQVELRSGLLVRQHRSVARDRLRSVDLTADVAHRLAGLAVVAIGTGRQGGESDDEVKLDSVAAAEAERLRVVLLSRDARPGTPGATAAPPHDAVPPLAVFDASWVRLAPLSLLGLVAIGLLGAAAGQLARVADVEVFEWGPVPAVFDWFGRTPLLVSVLGGLAVLAVLNAVLSTVVYIVLYGGFELTRAADGTLRISYGLLTRRSVSIEERRIRGVALEEPLLLRLGRGARAKIVAAGLGTKDRQGKDKLDSDLLLPAVPITVAHRVTAAVLESDSAPVTAPLARHPVAALRVLARQWVAAAAVPAAVLGLVAGLGLVPHWTWQVALLLLPPAAAFAVLEYRNLGHGITDRFLVIRAGSTMRRTVALRRDGIIAWRFRRSVLQRRPRLLTVSAAVAAGKGAHTISYADQDEVLAMTRDAVPGLLAPFLEIDAG
ncbi:MAG: PH domain-containing protein [Pseudonocardia sp.]